MKLLTINKGKCWVTVPVLFIGCLLTLTSTLRAQDSTVAEAPQAHRAVLEPGAFGKTVLTV